MGPDQDTLCWCSAAWGAVKVGKGRWNVVVPAEGPSDVQDV